MITRVRLQNWSSFGAAQTAPLEAITVLVGANNSGKSNFLRFLRLLHQADRPPDVHRPVVPSQHLELAIAIEHGSREIEWTYRAELNAPNRIDEEVLVDGVHAFLVHSETGKAPELKIGANGYPAGPSGAVFFTSVLPQSPYFPQVAQLPVWAALRALRDSRLVHLRVESMRESNQVAASAAIQPDGSQLAALIARWTLAFPDRLEEFTQTLRRCVPEVKRVLTPPTTLGHVQLLFEQVDGERFTADEVSDGVLVFAALIAHALEAPPNGLVLLEEPERGLHPRRLRELVDVLRTIVERRKTQFIMATHSPALLNVLRDEPDSILLFRRTQTGSEIRRLSEVPELAESLRRADPGELLADGVFNEGFRGEGPNEAASG